MWCWCWKDVLGMAFAGDCVRAMPESWCVMDDCDYVWSSQREKGRKMLLMVVTFYRYDF